MGKVNKKKKNKLSSGAKKVAALILGTVVITCAFDALRRDLFKKDTTSCVQLDGDFISSSKPSVPLETVPMSDVKKPESVPKNDNASVFDSIQLTDKDLSKGFLVLDDDNHSMPMADMEKMVDLSEYKNEYYTVMGSNVMLNAEAAEALNMLMTDYCEETSLKDFVVYGTTDTYIGESSFCPRYFSERATGNTIDFALVAYGSFIAYDGLDEESWLIENCSKYGFILRYPEDKSEQTGKFYCPWHLRYVGKLNAAIMQSKNMCLEEYVDFIKGYNADSPFTYKFNGTTYIVYSVKAKDDKTTIRVPANDEYEISGNNIDTYIVSYER